VCRKELGKPVEDAMLWSEQFSRTCLLGLQVTRECGGFMTKFRNLDTQFHLAWQVN
jgi:hypothetical protein